jgi:PKD repeat protein
LLILSVLALALILAFSASLNLARPPFVDVQTDGLTSWNPNVTCSADLVTVPDILGRSYPSQSLVGSRYQVNATAGGVPSKRALHPPCTLTNVTGKTVSTFVQVNRVYLYDYIFASGDCSKGFKAVNGGGPYPNGQTFCDNTGDIRAMGTTNGYIHIEFDQDWLAKGYCGATVPSCNNVTIAKNVSSGSISLDMQGFVFWDDNHWELHPLSAWRRTPPPPPPNAPPSADFSWSPTRGNTTTTFNFNATVSDDHDPPSSIQVRWDWNGDKTWDTPWSTTKTASHKFSVAGNYTVILEAMDTGGLTTNRSHVLSVTAPAPPPPPPPNTPPSADFSWSPTRGNTTTTFNFTASVSDDHDPPGSIQVRWDWNGDGTWDTAWSTTKTAQHQYGTPGNYTVVVAAMDTGGLTSTQSHVLTVTAPPPPPPPPPPPGDFTIGANPISLKIVIGSSGTSAITLKSLNGLSGTANLKASISSSDIIVVWPTASINPSSLTLPANGTASSTLTVSTTVLTTPATYTVTVTATVGSISHAVVVTVQVTLPPSNSSLGLVGSQPRMIRDSDL